MAKKFYTESGIARLIQKCGWSSKTSDEAVKLGHEAVPFRRVDAGNLARIATALEGIDKKLGTLLKKQEA